MKTTVYYHANCNDGFAAALVAGVWLGEEGRLQDTEFIPVHYGHEPKLENYHNKDGYILDFSFPRDTLIEMHENATSLVVLDHHETAQEALVGLDYCVFDMQKSGAVLTWEHFFPSKDVPLFLHYIQDRDLWKWLLPQSKEVSAAISSYERNFSLWLKWLLYEEYIEELKLEGQAILRYQNQQVDAALNREHEMVEIGGCHVKCINTTTLISEICGALAKGQPFAATYFDLPKKRVYSLRSDSEGEHVGKIARQYGGGGHARAAGFSIPRLYHDIFASLNTQRVI